LKGTAFSVCVRTHQLELVPKGRLRVAQDEVLGESGAIDKSRRDG